MNKKKILVLAMSLAMVAILAIGSTIAYFSDADKDVNVMTTANLKIVQNETERDGSEYVDGQALLPAVYFDKDGNQHNPTATWQGPDGGSQAGFTGPDGEDMALYADSINNEIDKIVSVTNNGSIDAYVRTLVLLEDNDNVSDLIHIVYSDTDVCAREIIDQVKVGDNNYEVWVFTYVDAVAPTKTTKASLKQVWLDPMADNTWYDKLGDGKFEIIALSQAAQVAGFEGNPTAALDAAFGDVTAENIAKWVAETNVKTTGLNNVVK